MVASRAHVWREKTKQYLWVVVRTVLIVGVSYIIVKPLLFKFASSVMSKEDVFDISVRLIPKHLSFANYVRASQAMGYWSALRNTFPLTLVISVLQLVSCTIIGYGFARFKFRGNGILFSLVLLTLLVPPQLIMIPLYMNFRFFTLFGLLGKPGINLLGTYWPFILTSLTGVGLKNGLFIYIMRQHFRGMPDSLEEAAYVDGAGAFRTFYQVMLPGAGSVLIVVFLFSFVWQWNDNFYTSIFLQGSNAETLSSALIGLPRSYLNYHQTQFGQPPSIPYIAAVMNSAMIMFIAPLLLIFITLQKYETFLFSLTSRD